MDRSASTPITGTINGAVGPDRFTIAENSPAGSVIGTPLPQKQPRRLPADLSDFRRTTPTPPSRLILSPASSPSPIPRPSISKRFPRVGTVPSVFNLVVTISDSATPELDESLRVVSHRHGCQRAPHDHRRNLDLRSFPHRAKASLSATSSPPIPTALISRPWKSSQAILPENSHSLRPDCSP